MLDRHVIIPVRTKRWFHDWSSAEYEAAVAIEKVRGEVHAALDQIRAYMSMTENPIARIVTYDPPWGDYWTNRPQRIPIKPLIGGKMEASIPPEFSLAEYMRAMESV